MKNLVLLFGVMFFAEHAFCQKAGDKLLISESCNLYDIPSIMGKATPLMANDTITILKPEDERTGYYYVKYRDTSGYINAIKVVLSKKLENPGYRKTRDKSLKETESLKKIVEYYTSLYGKPDDSSLFTTDVIKSRTLVWFCSKGNYRLISLKLEKGEWVKESETVSDCILYK